jgi:hypothetical protein
VGLIRPLEIADVNVARVLESHMNDTRTWQAEATKQIVDLNQARVRNETNIGRNTDLIAALQAREQKTIDAALDELRQLREERLRK